PTTVISKPRAAPARAARRAISAAAAGVIGRSPDVAISVVTGRSPVLAGRRGPAGKTWAAAFPSSIRASSIRPAVAPCLGHRSRHPLPGAGFQREAEHPLRVRRRWHLHTVELLEPETPVIG